MLRAMTAIASLTRLTKVLLAVFRFGLSFEALAQLECLLDLALLAYSPHLSCDGVSTSSKEILQPGSWSVATYK